MRQGIPLLNADRGKRCCRRRGEETVNTQLIADRRLSGVSHERPIFAAVHPAGGPAARGDQGRKVGEDEFELGTLQNSLNFGRHNLVMPLRRCKLDTALNPRPRGSSLGMVLARTCARSGWAVAARRGCSDAALARKQTFGLPTAQCPYTAGTNCIRGPPSGTRNGTAAASRVVCTGGTRQGKDGASDLRGAAGDLCGGAL